jgi:hypothetical protein
MTGLVKMRAADDPHAVVRWECRCQPTPVLLATYDARGLIHIKVRDRYWHVSGTVHTVCPRCGSEHALDLRRGVEQSSSREDEPEVGSRKAED